MLFEPGKSSLPVEKNLWERAGPTMTNQKLLWDCGTPHTYTTHTHTHNVMKKEVTTKGNNKHSQTSHTNQTP